MSRVESDKMMDILSEVISKMLRDAEKKRKEELAKNRESNSIENNDLSKEKLNDLDPKKESNPTNELSEKDVSELQKNLTEHGKELNDFIDTEMKNDKDEYVSITRDEVEGMLNDHFNRIDALLHSYQSNNLDSDSFKERLSSALDQFKANAKVKFNSIKKVVTKPIDSVKNFAKGRINDFLNKVNVQLKDISNNIEKRAGNERSENKPQEQASNKNEKKESVIQKELNYNDKIKKALENDPHLLKDAVLVTQLHAMNKHVMESERHLETLNKITHDNPMDQYKVNDMKNQLQVNISQMKSKMNELSNSHSKDDVLDQINNKVLEKSSEKTQEVTLDR